MPPSDRCKVHFKKNQNKNKNDSNKKKSYETQCPIYFKDKLMVSTGKKDTPKDQPWERTQRFTGSIPTVIHKTSYVKKKKDFP